MAIISCPSCGKSVSDKSFSCVHCGAPLVREPDNSPPFDKTGVGDGGQRGLGSAVAVEHSNMDYMEAFLKDDAKTARMVGKYNKLNAVYKRIAWLWDVFILVIIGLAVVLSQGTDFLNTFAGSYLIMLLIGVLLALLLGFRFIYNRSVEFVYSLRCAKWIKKNGYDVSQYIIDKFNETEANLDNEGVIGTGELFDFTAASLFAKDERARETVKLHFIIRTMIAAVLSAWLVIPAPIILSFLLTSSFNVGVLLSALIPMAILLLAYFITFFTFTVKDSAKVRKLYYKV